MSLVRWCFKADSFIRAWVAHFGSSPISPSPTASQIALCMAVAELETACGDAWPGEHNWGGVQAGPLTPPGAVFLAKSGCIPNPANLSLAKKLLAENGFTYPGRSLHVDSTPTPSGPRYYFALFYAFDTDDAGALEFVQALVANKANVQRALAEPTCTAQQLAQAMYDARYFEGFHDPSKPGGREANVDDYAKAIESFRPIIEWSMYRAEYTQGQSLKSTMLEMLVEQLDPSAPATDAMAVQEALNVLSFVEIGKAPLLEDDKIGPQTTAYIEAFQKTHGLAVDGDAGHDTRTVLVNAVKIAIATALAPAPQTS